LATLSRKRTGSNITVWEDRILGKSDWNKFADLLFVESKTPVNLIDSDNISIKVLKNLNKLRLLNNKQLLIGKSVYANVSYNGTKGYLPITKIGYPAKSTVKDESLALDNLDKLIKTMDDTGKGITIVVKHNNRIHYRFENCTGAKTNAGTPKSDFYIHNSGFKPVCQISHKKAGGPSAYQQYVSITGIKNDVINQHPIVKSALRTFSQFHNDVVKNHKRFFIKLSPNDRKTIELVKYAIYGPEYGKSQYGVDNIHLIGQGDPVLTRIRDPKCTMYELTFTDKISISGDLSKFFKSGSGYEPIILMRYSNGRQYISDNETYTGARVLICPTKLKSGTAQELKL